MLTRTTVLDLRGVATHLNWYLAALERGHGETVRQVSTLLTTASQVELDAYRPAVLRLLQALPLGLRVRLRYTRPGLCDLLAS